MCKRTFFPVAPNIAHDLKKWPIKQSEDVLQRGNWNESKTIFGNLFKDCEN